MKQCNICNEFKPESSFSKNKHTSDGLLKKCKDCTKQYTKDLQNGIRMSDEDRLNQMRLSKRKGMETERELTKYMLRVMGYEPDSLISVHEQFLVRHLLDAHKEV
jgi:hypothetical protein